MKIIIIGGGISGLSAAYYAHKKMPAAKITLLESGLHWGGKITTDRVEMDGKNFIIEGGPDTFLATKPWAVALCKELGLGERLHGTNPHQKNTYVLHHNHLLPLPDGLAMMIPTNVQAILRSRLVSWAGKMRMGLDFVLPQHPLNGDESLGHFVSRRLGREAYENLIEPLMSGIYAGDGDQLSLASTFPYLRDLELNYGSLARGALEMRKKMNASSKASVGSRSAFLTPTTGMLEMVEKLEDILQNGGMDMRLNAAAAGITFQPPHYQVQLQTGENLTAEHVILATPSFVSATLLQNLDAKLAAELEKIPHVSTATISLAYRLEDVPRKLDGYGYVNPRREGRKALACTWTSTKFPHRAPEGYALLRVFVGRAGQEFPWNEEELLAIAREEVELTLGITAQPLLARVYTWLKSMPQYNLGHPDILKHLDAAQEKHPGLALAGNSYRGIGVPDCIHSGELAVDRILSQQPIL